MLDILIKQWFCFDGRHLKSFSPPPPLFSKFSKSFFRFNPIHRANFEKVFEAGGGEGLREAVPPCEKIFGNLTPKMCNLLPEKGLKTA